VHGNLVLDGPVWWVAVTLLVVTWALSGFTAFDSLRASRAEQFVALPEVPWVYFVPSVTFFLMTILAQLADIPVVAIAVIVAAPFILVLGMVYLLRVAFPKHPAK
jgi:hypothetical protein